MTALGVLCCFALFVCLTLLASFDLACFFLSSFSSLIKNMYIHRLCMYMWTYCSIIIIVSYYSVHIYCYEYLTLKEILRGHCNEPARYYSVHVCVYKMSVYLQRQQNDFVLYQGTHDSYICTYMYVCDYNVYIYTMYMCNVLINYYVIINVPTLHPTHISY